MTKTQAAARTKVGITLDHVVRAAFDVLQRDGIAKLSTRAIAAELNVRTNTVMWHIRTKDRLLGLMAESIVGEVDLGNLHGGWREQVAELLRRLRQAMLGHRDGALIVAGTFPVEPNTLAFSDRLVTVLFDGCPTRESAAWTSWSLFYFTLGLVQEEQATPAAFHDRLRESVNEQNFPGLHSVLADYISIDYNERFDFGIEQILRSAPTTRPRSRPGS
ncbi:TetR/AcrR family transcriptional regulator C-terminal domain-containing protein [Streptomyces sp. NPDC088400]|uniref:TetR/AcrR family transcriptional regulator C-terminal domain-containing protein n=1 Tax=Streptomyces sp. NPDC088400 TaxID=3365861 RepID=UPI00382AC749